MFCFRPRRAFTREVTPRVRDKPAPRDPFLNGSTFSTGSKNAVTCAGQNALLSEAMEDRPPDRLRRHRLRPGELLPAAPAVEDEDRRLALRHLRHIVRDDEVELRLPEQGHRAGAELRGRHLRLRLEPDEDLRALA